MQRDPDLEPGTFMDSQDQSLIYLSILTGFFGMLGLDSRGEHT